MAERKREGVQTGVETQVIHGKRVEVPNPNSHVKDCQNDPDATKASENEPLQTTNPMGFQAWRRFVTKDRWPRRMEEFPWPNKPAANGDPGSHEEEKTEEVDWAAGVTWAMIAAELVDMPLMNSDVNTSEEEIREVELDVTKAASKLGRLRKTGVILQTIESSPSRDRVVAWMRDSMCIRKGARVVQVKAMAKREFFIVFASEEGKNTVMEKPPCFLDGKIVRLCKVPRKLQELG
ncbi:hypothetical protein R1sor_016572 [Riccia sorocarpa]|uniref:DUF4283 domain-containing protein n=1 Tax=Riccia sorocarpa TaxID=122646 RepID=A0ABD3HFT9_9MARC